MTGSMSIHPEVDSPVEVIMTPQPPQNLELVLEIPKPVVNSRYTAHFMEYKSVIETADQESPTRSRYHNRRAHTHTNSTSSSDGSPQSGLTDEISSAETLLCDGMLFLRDDLVSPIPDLLHSVEKTYPRHGPARRGWMNLGSVITLTIVLIALFAIWPAYAYVNRFAKIDLQTQDLMRQSGPFARSDLPRR
ncbi:hypothetical protein DFH28DRAFT_1130351 [Melampsora americana]|nr:hypothetical protein DFH28DRAFT_1130351 [Melampsora americana]